MTEVPAIDIDRVTYRYGEVPILKDVRVTVNELDFVWIVGPNGGGKTTLLKLILGLLSPATGRISIFGRPPVRARREIGYMPQVTAFDPRFPVNVMDVVLMGRHGDGRGLGPFRRADKATAEEALLDVNMADKRRLPFSSLSGGQQRRILIARALASQPRILLLDEPTANLDLPSERELYELLRKLNRRLTIVMVSHDPSFVSDFVQRVICVNREVHEHPTCEIDGVFMGEYYGGEGRGIRMVRHDRHLKEGSDND